MFHRILLVVVLLVMVIFDGASQRVSGVVKDAESGAPVPFVNVLVKGTLQGVTTDLDGRFTLESPGGDTLVFSSVGYYPGEEGIRRNSVQQLTIFLKPNVEMLGEVTVKPEIERAVVLFHKIQEHKSDNRRQLINMGSYKTLSVTNVYVAIDTASNVSRLIDDFKKVTIESDNQQLRFSPVYLSETAKEVSGDSTHILYSAKDGIFPRINQAIETYVLRNVVVDLDFYDEQINILDRSFLSPIGKNALSRYNLYLNDSSMVDGTKYFHFSFAPKNRYDQLFAGNFKIENGSFALTEIEVNVPREANLNFVKGFRGRVKYQKFPERGWFYDEQDVRINLALRPESDSVSIYSSERVEDVAGGNWIVNQLTQYSISERLDYVKAENWGKQPEFVGSGIREDDYYRVEMLKQQKIVKGVDAIGGLALTGYVNAGKIDLGPVFDIYSSNAIEGHRFTLPLRTSEQMSKHFSIGGFAGMGTRSRELKYGGNVIWQPGETDKYIFRVNYSNDYSLISHDKFYRFIKNNPNNKGNGNFIAAITTREKNPYLKEEQSIDFRVEFNANDDFQLEFSPYYLYSQSTPEVRFYRGGDEYQSYENYGVLLNLRIVSGQHFDKFYFDRIYYVDPIPVINLSWDVGQIRLPGREGHKMGLYSHINGAVKGRINMGQIFMHYMVNAGFLFGDAPYDLLDQPVGSMSLGYAKYRFNLLHHASFAHNLYTNTHFHFNGGGVLLNRVPLIKRLKLREIVSFKGHYGTMTEDYKGVFDLPNYYNTSDSEVPYAEIGVGLTNIFKILRIEYVRLLGNYYLNEGFTDKDGIRIRAEMSF
ncbi:DUF5686 family protein [Thermophagus sp. OGC60D27]|uniref:DUF5686 family protein n=1 Tax=Thermophagus sp. OGC60D27 TaxID=3458415 RepID=UPI004037AC45